MASGVATVMAVLGDDGYKAHKKPLVVAGSEFDFEAAAVGTGTSHDLVLVASDQMPRPQLRRLVTAVARSLDVAASKRPITLVYLGAMTAAEKVDVERFARVLVVPTPDPTRSEVEAAVAVLLRLRLPAAALRGREPMAEVHRALGTATPEQQRLLSAAAGGPDEVREALRQFVNEAVGIQDGGSNG
jgi:hypothetical protein